MERKDGWKKLDRETIVFILFLICMAVYYGWRMFALTPWYDELYTYYYFISRGPVYAAIHWPLPNNHVGYSVLSAVFNWTGSSAVGLRGVSYLSSLGCLLLLYWIGRRCFPKGIALLTPCLFASMNLVNQMAIQGRGYALVTFFYLLAFCGLWKIVVCGEKRVRIYILFGVSLVWSLYTLASSVYFVLPLCVTGGIALLCGKRFREFWNLVVISLLSAVCTVGLYGIIWLAIGSNLLSKKEGGPYFGVGHVQIILHAPFTAAKEGIDYMLGMPYIQSVARQGYLRNLGDFIRTLFNYYFNGLAYVLIGIVVIGLVLVVRRLVFQFKSGTTKLNQEQAETEKVRQDTGFMEWYLLISFLMTPFILIIQAALPYYRVFSYFGVALALMCTWLISQAVSLIHTVKTDVILKGFSLGVSLLAFIVFLFPQARVPYSARETAIETAYRAVDISHYDKIAVADCDQEYLLKYLYGLDMESDGNIRLTTVIEDADCVLLDKDLLLPDGHFVTRDSIGDWWKLYVARDTLPAEYLEEQMQAVYENDRFVFYERK